MKAVAETLGVSRSNLVERLAGGAKPRRRYQKAQDAAVLPLVRRLVDARPTYTRRTRHGRSADKVAHFISRGE